jgi:hypothetical protein
VRHQTGDAGNEMETVEEKGVHECSEKRKKRSRYIEREKEITEQRIEKLWDSQDICFLIRNISCPFAPSARNVLWMARSLFFRWKRILPFGSVISVGVRSALKGYVSDVEGKPVGRSLGRGIW